MFAPVGKSHLAPVNSATLDEAVLYGVKHGWLANNPRISRGVARISRTGDIVTESMLFSRKELDLIPFNAEFPNRFDLRWFVGGLLVPAGDASVVFSIERRKDQEPFSKTELDVLRKILPHLQRAGLAAAQWAEAMAQGVLDAFECMGAGAILIGAGGRVVRMSRRAEAQLGVAFRLDNGHLFARSAVANAAFQRLIGSIVSGAPLTEVVAVGPVALPRPRGRPLIVSGSMTSAQPMRVDRGALVLSDPDETSAPSAAALRAAFGLTPTECKVAELFATGCDIEQIAASMTISVATARVHFKAIMAKTQTRRQSELAIVLARIMRA